MSAFWKDRPTLVTGASGLVGSWLVKKLLAERASVVCLVRDWVPQSELARAETLAAVQVVRGDLRDQPLLERILGEYEVDTVFHLAAQTIVPIANRNPISTFESNVQGTWCLLEACRRSPRVRQVVHASSDKAYGGHGRAAYSEETPLQGVHPYDVSKSCADLLAQSYASSFGVPVAITRCGNFFGGGDLNWNRLVPGTLRSALQGKAPVIRSDGTFVRDYLYVEDGAAAYMMLAQKLAEDRALIGQAFNFSSEAPLTVRAMVDLLLAHLGSQHEVEVLNQASNEIPYQALDAGKARRVLGWKLTCTLDEALQRTIAWYRHFLKATG